MSGIFGIFDRDNAPTDKKLLIAMNNSLRHRGLDDEGYLFVNTFSGQYINALGKDTSSPIYNTDNSYNSRLAVQDIDSHRYNLAFGYRRLSILDLSPTGHQPMCDNESSIWIVHDGTIYNYMALKEELEKRGYVFRSKSDTEVIIYSYKEWGTKCLEKFNGIWAFCIWDSLKKRLFFACDRFGIKPLYYFVDGARFYFASEIKTLLKAGVQVEPNEGLIFDFIKFGSVYSHIPGETFFGNVKVLPQSHYLIVDMDGNINLNKYWDFEISNEIGEWSRNDQETEDFKNLFIDSVKLRLNSDVPIGFSLSGGLDSTSIVSIANKLLNHNSTHTSAGKLETFSACFTDHKFDERKHIEEVITKTDANRNYVFPQASGFLEDLNKIIRHQEEPFQGGAIYSQWEILKEANRKGVRVMLAGQGADEQLAGYVWVFIAYLRYLTKSRMYARCLEELAQFMLSPATVTNFIRIFNMGGAVRYFSNNKLANFDGLLKPSFVRAFEDRNVYVGYQWDIGARAKKELVYMNLPVFLKHEERSSAAHSIEARNPFLDYRIVEMLARLPLNQKFRHGYTKYILRNAMKGILPDKVRLQRSKVRFGMHAEKWLKNELTDHVRKVFSSPLFISNYVNRNVLAEQFDRYMSNRSFLYNDTIFLRFYILELWGREFILGESSKPSSF